jgi:hypothetical protein
MDLREIAVLLCVELHSMKMLPANKRRSQAVPANERSLSVKIDAGLDMTEMAAALLCIEHEDVANQ